MELYGDLYQITGHVIAMNFDAEKQMTGVVVMKQSGSPALLEVYDGYLEQQILDMKEGEEATFWFDRYCMLERIMETPDEVPAIANRKEKSQ